MAKIMDEPQIITNSSTKMAKIMDEPQKITNSSTKTAKIMDEPQKITDSSTNMAKIMDESRKQFSPVKSAGSSVKGPASICRGKLPAPGLRTIA